MHDSYFKKANFYYKEFKFNRTNVLIYSKSNVNWENVLKEMNKIPKYLKNIDLIYYGKHQDLKDHNHLSKYHNGTILISDAVGMDEDVLKCIIHECIHSFVEDFENINFFEESRNEYLEKKSVVLNKMGDVGDKYRQTVYYNKAFDGFLMDYGYKQLKTLIKGKMPSAYSVTSMIEFVAITAEELFFGKSSIISDICPMTCKFIKSF